MDKIYDSTFFLTASLRYNSYAIQLSILSRQFGGFW